MTLALNFQRDLFVASDKTTIDRDFYNRRMTAIYNALTDLDGRMTVFGGTESTLVDLGLQRLNTTLGPMLLTLQDAAALGFLVCGVSGEAHALVLGHAEGWHVSTGADLFTPTPFLMVQDNNDSTNWGIVSVDTGGWTASTGDLATHVVFTNKTQSSSQWTISANAAFVPAMQSMLSQTVAANTSAQAALTTINADMASLASLQAAIAAGPVASVAGRTGVVVLGEGDITGLATDLSNRPTATTVNSQLTAKQNASTKLDALVNLTWAANKLIYGSGATTLTTADVSNFMLTVLASANATSAQTALGIAGATTISPYMTTLLDDPDASTAQTTLGISAFIKTLLTAADAATSRTTLGAAAATAVPTKASSATIAAATDDTQFATALGIAATYSPKTMAWAAPQAAGFTLDASFNGQAIPWTASAANTVTLANNAAAGTECMIVCEGAGQITFAAQSGGSVQSRGARLKSNGQYSMISALVRSNSGTNAAWRLGGDLTV